MSNLLRENGVNVPLVHAFDLDSGFMIVSDFGDDLLQFKINRSNAFELYQCAFKEMILINSIPKHDNFSFLTEQEIRKQMSLFEEWFLKGLLGISLNKKEKSYLEFIFDQIVQIFFEQPQVLCHFDFETRNLLALPGNRLGVLDFQDAVVGPLFLDPSSLLKDLHFDSTYEEVFKFLDIYLEKAIKVGLLSEQEIDKVPRWFDLTSLQRQLRILGTLSRLH